MTGNSVRFRRKFVGKTLQLSPSEESHGVMCVAVIEAEAKANAQEGGDVCKNADVIKQALSHVRLHLCDNCRRDIFSSS